MIEALLTSDDATLIDLVEWESIACSSKGGLPNPPTCSPGIADGTLVDAIPWGSGGEGGHITRDELELRGIFIGSAYGGEEYALCRIGGLRLEDGTVRYGVELKAVSADPNYDSHIVDTFSVTIVDGRITFRGRMVDPGYSLAQAICR